MGETIKFVGMSMYRGIVRNQGFLGAVWLRFGVDEHPCATYFDVHQGCRVLTHSQMGVARKMFQSSGKRLVWSLLPFRGHFGYMFLMPNTHSFLGGSRSPCGSIVFLLFFGFVWWFSGWVSKINPQARLLVGDLRTDQFLVGKMGSCVLGFLCFFFGSRGLMPNLTCSPTAESFGVSAQTGAGVVRGGPNVRFYQGSTRVPPGFNEVPLLGISPEIIKKKALIIMETLFFRIPADILSRPKGHIYIYIFIIIFTLNL